MAKYSIEDSTLSAIAEAIREKGGTTEAMTPADMAEAIAAIQAGGGGRPYAFGTVSISNSYTATVDGLPFQPSIIVMFYNNASGMAQNAAMSVLADIEGNFKTLDYNMYDSETWNYIYAKSSSGAPVTVSVTGSSFTIKGPMNFRGTYRWYAIGAEG